MDEYEELAKKKEVQKFNDAIGAENDPVMLVLRAHLFSENLLERLINSKLPRGDKLIENGNLTYHQKLVLVDALDCLPDSIISSLRNLNKLRNQCAHELDKKIADGDITKIGSPLGKIFTEQRRRAQFSETALLRSIIAHVCGYVTASCFIAENPSVSARKPTTETQAVVEKTSLDTRSTKPDSVADINLKAAQDGQPAAVVENLTLDAGSNKSDSAVNISLKAAKTAKDGKPPVLKREGKMKRRGLSPTIGDGGAQGDERDTNRDN